MLCCIGIIIATIFQNKQKKKYNECLHIIKEKGIDTLQAKTSLTKEDINKIDDKIDVDKLMEKLYQTYLSFESKIKSQDINLDNILTGYIKDFYINKINSLKSKGYEEITDNIDLINYSIVEFSKEKLKFRITVNCFNYKMVNKNIVSGNNLEKIEKVLIITYEKVKSRWLISNYESIYERKLSE